MKKTIRGHDYVFAPLPYDDALTLSAEVMAAAIPVLGSLIDGPVGKAMAGEIDWSDLASLMKGPDESVSEEDDALVRVLDGVDVDAVCQRAADALRSGVIRPALIRSLLSTTTRDGILLAGPAFDAAYRGALMESIQAAFYAVQANGLFELPSTSAG